MYKKRINYWHSFFPEIEDKKTVNKIISILTNKTLEYYADEYENVQDKMSRWIHTEFFKQNISENQKQSIMEELSNKYKWIGFFIPILEKKYSNYKQIIFKNSSIKNPVDFLKSFRNTLIDRMFDMSFRVLVLETQIAKNDGLLQGETAQQRGKYFCEKLLLDDDYLYELYCAYPVLIQLINQMVEKSIIYLSEILQDYRKIEHKFGNLINIVWEKGDLHNGKSVAILECEKGKVVYKPRKAQIEEKYTELMMWLHEVNNKFIKIDTCKAWNLNYGSCMEFVDNVECSDKNEVEQFYYRIGELLCILYTLNSKDFHCENIIAKKDMPILIDLETLVHSTLKLTSEESIVLLANDMIEQSVIGTAILPTLFQNNKTEDVMEVGGIGSGKKQKSPYKTKVIKDFDTDEISIEFEKNEIKPSMNYPKYHNKIIGCEKYLEIIKSGFQDVYTWIDNHKEIYINKITSLFSGLQCRVICKNTNIYSQLLETGLHPDLLHNTIDRQIYLCRIGLVMNQNKEYKNCQIYQNEYRDLIDGDVPYFTILCNENKIFHKGNQLSIHNKNKKCILKNIEDKINHMGNTDMDRQLALINESFIGSKLILDLPYSTTNHLLNEKVTTNKKNTVWLAKKIGDLCLKRGCKGKINDSYQLTWIGMLGFGDGFYNITPVGFGMYQGNAGIALFLYFLSLEDAQYLKVFEYAMEPVVLSIFEEIDKEICLEGAGALTGFMSKIYSILCIAKRNADFISKKKLQYIILNSIRVIKRNVKDDKKFDFLSGISGILGVYITAIEYIEPKDKNIVMNFMKYLAEQLKQNIIEIENGVFSWNNTNDIGYAHGNAGITTQLYRYYKISSDQEILNIIQRVIEYERKYCFDKQENCWIIRKDTHYYSWCNGIGGLLLEKLFLLKNGYKDNKLELEIKELIKQLIEQGFGTDLSICHGDMGTIQLLEYAAKVLNDKELESNCIHTLNKFAIMLWEEEWQKIKRMENWGMMTGISGLGLGFIAKNKDIIDFLLLE